MTINIIGRHGCVDVIYLICAANQIIIVKYFCLSCFVYAYTTTDLFTQEYIQICT